MRIIIEGMDHDNTNLNYIIREAEIPENTSRIIVGFCGNKLDIVGRFSDGKLHKIDAKENIEAHLDYIPIYAPEAPQTIILEDGRVYSWATPKRLEAVVRDMKIVGGFDNAYQQIQQNPAKFYC